MHAPSPAPSRTLHRTILLVVAEPAIRELLAASFRHAGLFPVAAASADEGHRLAGEVRPDVLLIDLDSPATADLTLLRLHAGRLDVVPPLLVTLSARPDASVGPAGSAVEMALQIAKPFSPRELVGSVLRALTATRQARAPAPAPRKLRVGALEFDPDRQCALLHHHGQAVSLALAPTELKLLRCLMEHTDRLLSRAQLLRLVWGDGDKVDPRTVDQNVRRLRRCLEASGCSALIRTVRGLGYRLDIAVGPPSS